MRQHCPSHFLSHSFSLSLSSLSLSLFHTHTHTQSLLSRGKLLSWCVMLYLPSMKYRCDSLSCSVQFPVLFLNELIRVFLAFTAFLIISFPQFRKLLLLPFLPLPINSSSLKSCFHPMSVAHCSVKPTSEKNCSF